MNNKQIDSYSLNHIVLWLSRETELIGKKEIYFQVLDHVNMEAERSHHLLSARWRPKKTTNVVQRPRSWRDDGIDSSLSLKA